MRTEEAVTRVREQGGWARLDRLGLIRVSGPNRAKFLHNLLSNDINGLASGQSRLAALMNLKGHQVAWMRVLAESDALICELPVGVRETVLETFTHYKVGAPVRFEKTEASVLGLFGGGTLETLNALGVSCVPLQEETFETAVRSEGPLRVSRGKEMPARGFTLHITEAGASALEASLRSLLGEPIAPATLDTLRVEEGLPWHGIDVVEENLLHETGQLAVYHSSSKGCYLGQEVVARLEGRGGNVNKKFVGLKSPSTLSIGADVAVDGKVVGRVTSAGVSPVFGPIAMGYVHRSHAEPGTRVSIGEAEAEIALLPFRT